MDWQGQKLAEQIMEYAFLAAAILALMVGYLMGSIKVMLIVYSVFVLVILLLVVPDWPLFNRHPIEFLDPKVVPALDAAKVPPQQPKIAHKKAAKPSKQK